MTTKKAQLDNATTRESDVARACRRLVRTQSLKAAGVSALPIAGVDLYVNGKLLVATIARINTAFGLAPEQVAQLAPPLRNRIDTLAQQIGGFLIGRVATQAAVFAVARSLGLRLGVQQAAKLAPIVGQAASAALAGWLFKRLCERHIRQCLELRAALPELPPPPGLALPSPAERGS